MIVRDTKILDGRGDLRLSLFWFVKMQGLHNHVIGEAVLVTRIDGRSSRCCRGCSSRRRLFGDLQGEQVGVTLVMAYSILE